MGHPKALLPFRGGTFLSEIAGTFAGRCSPIIAVFGYDAYRMIEQAPASVIPVANPSYRHGMITSLQAGLRAAPHDCEAALFTLVDHPAVDPATIDTLLSYRGTSTITIPRFEKRRGHPVLIRRPIFAEFLNEPPTSKVRDVIDRHAHEITYIDVADPGVTQDIDDPAMYEELLARI